MTDQELTEEQLEAIVEAINREGWENKDPEEVAQLLREEGHEAFVAVADDPLGVGPPPGAEGPAAPAGSQVDEQLAGDDQGEQLPTHAKHEVSSRADLYGGYDDGLDDELDGDDLLVPRLKIKQSQTKDPDGLGISDLELGVWFHTNDPEINGASRTLVFVALSKERSFMGPYGKKKRGQFAKLLDELGTRHGVSIGNRDAVMDGAVICSSRDRLTPQTQKRWGGTLGIETTDANGNPCRACKVLDDRGKVVKECPEAKWTGGSRNCNESYVLAAFDVTDGLPGLPCVVDLNGSAYKVGKALLTSLKTRRRLKRLPMFGFTVEVSTHEEDKEDGKYYLPKFGPPTPMPKEDLEVFLPVYAETAADFARDGEE